MSASPQSSSSPQPAPQRPALSLPLPATVAVAPIQLGGCGASLQSVYALRATRYQAALRKHGITFAHHPRQADVLLLIGTVTAAKRPQVERLLATVPQPYIIVAVGNCAIDGCIFRANPQLEHDVFRAHVEIAGCPPTPDAVLAAILTAKRLLLGEPAPAANEAAATSNRLVSVEREREPQGVFMTARKTVRGE